MKSPKDALEAVADAAAVLNFAVSMLDPHDGTIGELTDEIHRLSRAVSRAEMIATIAPEATVETPTPQHFGPDDTTERAMTLDRLQTIAAMPSEPIAVVLRVRRFHDGSSEDAVRSLLDNMVLTAQPGGHWYELDANRIASQIGQYVL